MAGPCACQSHCQNLPLNGKDKLAEANQKLASSNDSRTLIHNFAMLRFLTLAFASALATAKLVTNYINPKLQKATKLALKLFVLG